MRRSLGFKTLAILELTKGVAVLLASLVLFFIEHPTFSSLASNILSHFHTVLLMSFITKFSVNVLYLLSGVYVVVRFAEGVGLWLRKEWGRLLSVYSTVMYLPFEFYELIHSFSLVKAAITLVNLGILLYLISLKRTETGSV